MRTIVVTGAAGGMGYELCTLLVGRGDTVVAVDHNSRRLKSLSIELGPSLLPVETDLKSPKLEDLVASSLESTPTFGGLVNLGGISKGDILERLTDEDWDESFSVNVTAAMRLCRCLGPRLRMVREGCIVNVASPVAIVGARKPSYAASKAALLGLTMSLARDFGRDNIRVNAVLPGPTITYMTNDWPNEKRRQIAESTFLGRLCEPIEIAHAICFLLSREASYITGSILDLTAGGMFSH